MSSSFAALAAARDASSDPSSPAAIVALEDITSSAKDTNRRASLAVAGVAALVADHLADASRGDVAGACAAGFSPPRARRNACAGDVVAKRDAARRGAHDALAAALVRLADAANAAYAANAACGSDSVVVSALAAGTQLACNLCAGRDDAARLAWRALFPRVAARLASVRGAAAHAAHPPLVALVHARHAAFGAVGEGAAEDAFDPTRPFGFEAAAKMWRPLLEAAADDDAPPGAGGGGRVVTSRRRDRVSLRRGGAPAAVPRVSAPRRRDGGGARRRARAKLLRLAVEDADESEMTDESDEARSRAADDCAFSVAQATLLALVTDAVEAAPETDPRLGSSGSKSSGSTAVDSGAGPLRWCSPRERWRTCWTWRRARRRRRAARRTGRNATARTRTRRARRFARLSICSAR